MLTIRDEISILKRKRIQVEFVRFIYDIENAAKAVEDSILPNEFADMFTVRLENCYLLTSKKGKTSRVMNVFQVFRR